MKIDVIFSDEFNEDKRFYWFVKRVNNYRYRYDYIIEYKPDPFDENGEWIGYSDILKETIYKIYDKYHPTIVARGLNIMQVGIILSKLENDDLIYQRNIYDYCYN